ncbi:TIR domain-containing protein [Nocardioides sp. URHA0020]|uniref:TIR domain-containing protein n=1 Tax=Nocardioides sp. URHA0020 TaxID=1380392 RepID=UPI0012DE2E5A|nr:TIR domain-containing protein [Nocardioides sp. URHA0020]
MPDEPKYEYDLAVSFAGEQRDYVKGVVRGLGDDLTVFYDEDEKAKLLGENLIDLLTDLYQNKAKYVAMFVSAAYAEKMWTNIERQSAMARAAQQRTAYILPIRMDDTDLPGLLPTVGYLDARVEGLDGVIKVIREKLAGQRVAATYTGRVPETQADIELLLALRPRFWEYWLYAGALRVGLAALEGKYHDYEMRFASPTGEAYFGRDAFDFLRTVPARATNLVDNFNAVFQPEVQLRAFGAPGDAGDADRILHMAKRFLDVYEGFLDEAARIRGTALDDDFEDAQRAGAEFGSDAVGQIREFITRCVESMSAIPEMTAEWVEGDEPIELALAITLTVDEEVSARFTQGLDAGVQAMIRDE